MPSGLRINLIMNTSLIRSYQVLERKSKFLLRNNNDDHKQFTRIFTSKFTSRFTYKFTSNFTKEFYQFKHQTAAQYCAARRVASSARGDSAARSCRTRCPRRRAGRGARSLYYRRTRTRDVRGLLLL